MGNATNNLNHLGPTATAPMSAVMAMITGLVKSIPNEEFGVLARWIVEEGNRRREHVRDRLTVGAKVVWINTTNKLTQGDVVELGRKNAKIRSEHGGELFVPLARLELAEIAHMRLSSLPPSLPPPLASGVAPAMPGVAKAQPRARRKTTLPQPL